MKIEAMAPPDLPRQWEGSVHSVFAHSCNVRLDGGELLTIHSFSFGMLPRSLYVPRLSTAGMRPGDRVVGGSEGVRIGSGLLAWDTGARWVNTVIPRRNGPPRAWRGALEALRDKRNSLGEDPVARQLYAVLRPALDGLWKGLRENDPAEVARQCRNCVGLGLGLTPSGDDMLLGTLTTLRMYAPELGIRLAEGIAPCLDRTNDISRGYLELALKGYAATPVIGAAQELGRGGIGSARLLLTIGHSSGSDILEGMITAAKQVDQLEKGRL